MQGLLLVEPSAFLAKSGEDYFEKKKEKEIKWQMFCFVLVWFFWFYGISTFVSYLTLNPFLCYNQFYFKQFSLARVHSLIVKKTFLFQTIQTVLIQLIQFSISTNFV